MKIFSIHTYIYYSLNLNQQEVLAISKYNYTVYKYMGKFSSYEFTLIANCMAAAICTGN